MGAGRKNPKFVVSDRDRFGSLRWYVRQPGKRKIRLPAGPGSLEFWPAYQAAIAGAEILPPTAGAEQQPGHIYFLQCRDRVKIGFSVGPISRLSSLLTSTPGPLTAVVIVKGTRYDERRTHDILDRSHVSGEWFEASLEVINAMGRAAKTGLLPHKTKSHIGASMESHQEEIGAIS